MPAVSSFKIVLIFLLLEKQFKIMPEDSYFHVLYTLYYQLPRETKLSLISLLEFELSNFSKVYFLS